MPWGGNCGEKEVLMFLLFVEERCAAALGWKGLRSDDYALRILATQAIIGAWR